MLLRRITQHVKEQNWFAVLLDFLIVVIGVFIGIQVANWNESQSTKAELHNSLLRLEKEVSHNINLIDEVLAAFKRGENDMNLGRDALNSCNFTPEGQAALERLFFQLTEDVQPNFATVALDQFAGQGRYQSLLSPQFQQDFGSYTGRLTEEHTQLSSHYENMWRHHVNFHPDVSADFPGAPGNTGDQSDYGEWGFKLGKPFEEMCTDTSFRNRFINTIGFYTSIDRRIRLLKSEVESFQSSINKELERY